MKDMTCFFGHFVFKLTNYTTVNDKGVKVVNNGDRYRNPTLSGNGKKKH